MEWEVPNTSDTKFRIGSISKQFTATIIMQLWEEGKIKLEGSNYRLSAGLQSETGKKMAGSIK